MDDPQGNGALGGTVAERMRRRFGDGALSWAEALPARLDRLAAAWGLTLGRAFPGGGSGVALRVERAEGPAVLRVSPDPAFAAAQLTALRVFAPTGRVPGVHAVDLDEGALLLELVEGGAGWPEPDAFGALLRDLHSADPGPVRDWPDLAAWTEEFLPRFTPTGPVTAAHLALARSRVGALLADPGPAPVLLHGDLHATNVVGRRRVIDPRPCVGDPEFDAVDFVLAGPDVPARLDALAAALPSLDAGRLGAWCRALAPVVAVAKARTGHDVGALLEHAEV
ncbi:phosphotransferase [Actinokineospora pegani]|uniref:phosphotransferase n=1 Tax=Actinokineospora pegani TaxID=2654637 RepID=UPI0012E9A62A|nr:phosphotransferase [Actinokineospora pegani]